VSEFLRGAKFTNIGVFNREMELPSDQYLNEEDFQFVLVSPAKVDFMNTKCSNVTIPLMGSVLKCKTNNPLVDIRSVYVGNRGKSIMMVKQLKHSQKGREETVPWVRYFMLVQASAGQNDAAQVHQHYDIVYVFITNRRITNMPKTCEP
jgi:hypothetical protein